MRKQPLLAEIRKSVHAEIIGQEKLIDRILVALLCEGHILLEGVPGLAKTKTVKSLTKALAGTMERIQFTADLLPSDIVGSEIFRPQTSEFTVRKGPVFANFLVGDEINRAPAKVQSALLQAMEEKEVTIGNETFSLPSPFFVLATQNPLDQEGTYQLPEAQLDRFMMKIVLDYPSYEEELSIIRQYGQLNANKNISNQVASLEDIQELKDEAQSTVHIDERLERYIVKIVHKTRETFAQGASPRAGIWLRKGAKAYAYLLGKEFVTPDDIKSIAPDILRHRIVLGQEDQIKGKSLEQSLYEMIHSVDIP